MPEACDSCSALLVISPEIIGNYNSAGRKEEKFIQVKRSYKRRITGVFILLNISSFCLKEGKNEPCKHNCLASIDQRLKQVFHAAQRSLPKGMKWHLRIPWKKSIHGKFSHWSITQREKDRETIQRNKL